MPVLTGILGLQKTLENTEKKGISGEPKRYRNPAQTAIGKRRSIRSELDAGEGPKGAAWGQHPL